MISIGESMARHLPGKPSALSVNGLETKTGRRPPPAPGC